MWTRESRGRTAELARKTKRYPSDLTDEAWAVVGPLLPRPARRGRPPGVAADYRAPEPALLRLPERLPVETAGDEAVQEALATVLSAAGGEPVPEDAMYDREREAFMALIRREETIARIAALVEPRKA